MDAHGQFVAGLIRSARKAHAAGTVLRMSAAEPDPVAAFGASGFSDLRAHAEGLLDHLCQALIVGRPELYTSQVAWLKQAFLAREVDLGALRTLLASLADELAAELPADAAKTATAIAGEGVAHLASAPAEIESALDVDGPHVERSRRYLVAALEGRRLDAIRLAENALADGVSVTDLYSKILGRAQAEIGRMWQRGEVHVGEEHLASRITEQVIAVVGSRMPRRAPNGKRVLMTTASGDLHDIGLRMVADHLEISGFGVVFLGASTPAEDVALAVRDFEVDLVAVAAKLVLHVRATAELIQAVRERTTGRRVPILVGGTAFQVAPDLWRVVGADGFALHASEAVAVAERLTSAS